MDESTSRHSTRRNHGLVSLLHAGLAGGGGGLEGKVGPPLKLGVCGSREFVEALFKTFFYPTILKMDRCPFEWVPFNEAVFAIFFLCVSFWIKFLCQLNLAKSLLHELPTRNNLGCTSRPPRSRPAPRWGGSPMSGIPRLPHVGHASPIPQACRQARHRRPGTTWRQ